MIFDDGERERVGVEVDIFVAEVDSVVVREVTEEIHLAIEESKLGCQLSSGKVVREE